MTHQPSAASDATVVWMRWIERCSGSGIGLNAAILHVRITWYMNTRDVRVQFGLDAGTSEAT